VDLLPLLTRRSRALQERPLFWRYGQTLAVRRGEWKLVRQAARGLSSAAEFELFNVVNDVAEKIDRRSERPDIARELISVVHRFESQMIAPLWDGLKVFIKYLRLLFLWGKII
jgi:arylsulfatase A-like enzyme